MRALAAAFLLFLLTGCSGPSQKTVSEVAPTTFVNRVWKVSESSGVAAGQLYVFLSEGTLVIASSTGRPSLGSWQQDGEHALTMVEEGLSYRVDIVEISATRFRIRVHNPGPPTEILLTPA